MGKAFQSAVRTVSAAAFRHFSEFMTNRKFGIELGLILKNPLITDSDQVAEEVK